MMVKFARPLRALVPGTHGREVVSYAAGWEGDVPDWAAQVAVECGVLEGAQAPSGDPPPNPPAEG